MIEYRKLTKEYVAERGTVRAVDEVSMRVETGEFCVLLGPSGCGKTTLLRMTNRLVEPTSGSILIDGANALDEDPVELRRRIGYVIQGVGLFPHRTVARNVATTLELLGKGGKESDRRVNELLEMVRLDPAHYRDRYPSELSGGEAQRVGVARALAADPPLLLMDEPFGAIDPINRSEIQREFLGLQRELRKTIILVTHDVSEAFLFGDRIALFRKGSLIRHASPLEMLRSPADDFTREFFGPEAELLLLDSFTVRDVFDPGTVADGNSDAVSAETSLKKVLGKMMATGERSLTVIDGEKKIGAVRLDAILEKMKVREEQQEKERG